MIILSLITAVNIYLLLILVYAVLIMSSYLILAYLSNKRTKGIQKEKQLH